MGLLQIQILMIIAIKTTNGDYVYYARHKRSDKSREIVDSDLDNPFMHYIDLSKDIDNIYQIINDNKKLKDRLKI